MLANRLSPQIVGPLLSCCLVCCICTGFFYIIAVIVIALLLQGTLPFLQDLTIKVLFT